MADYLNLDFNDIKQDIRNYIRDNSEVLADYNYEGSAISSMINVLAYVTQYNMHYLNMIATELGISTAKKAENIYKLANMLNYLPKRNVSPYIDVEVTNTSATDVRYINLGNVFEGGGVNLVYMGGTLTIPEGETKTIRLYAGERVTKTWMSDGRAFQTYTLVDREKVDNNMLYVGVSDDPTDTNYGWVNINVVNPIVGGEYYYIDYLDTMKIKFDDGSVYKKPLSEQNVNVMYLKNEGSTYNGFIRKDEEIDTEIADVHVITKTELKGGENAESLEEIKARAALMFTTQNRAITKGDYYNLFGGYSKVSEYEAYSIYGGESIHIDINGYEVEQRDVGSWPDTGFVYFSVLKRPDDIYNFEYLTNEEKVDIEQYFYPYKVITIFFKFVDPIIVYMKPKIRLELKSYVGVELDILENQIDNDIYDRYSGMDVSFNWSNLVNWLDGLEVVECCEVDYDVRVLVKKIEDITYKIIPISNKVSGIDGNYVKMTFSDFDININDILENGENTYKVTSVCDLEGFYYFSYLPLNGAPLLAATDTVQVYDSENTLKGTATVERENHLYLNEISDNSDIYLKDDNTVDHLVGSINCDTGYVTMYDMEGTLLKFMDIFVIDVELEDNISFDVKRELFLCPEKAEYEYV